MDLKVVLVSGILERLHLGKNNPFEHFSVIFLAKGGDDPIETVYEILSDELEGKDKKPAKKEKWQAVEAKSFNGYALDAVPSDNPPFKKGDRIKHLSKPALSDCIILSIWPYKRDHTWFMRLQINDEGATGPLDDPFDYRDFELVNTGEDDIFVRRLRRKRILAFSCLP